MLKSIICTSVLTLGLHATAAQAQSAENLIDQNLADQVDFRNVAFSVCFEAESCEVGVSIPSSSGKAPLELMVSIAAERDAGILEGWLPAELFWDPIDGIGVIGGGQNDEIDFSERVTVSFSQPADVSGIWLSDMFIAEQLNYGVRETLQDDVEAADVVATLENEMVFERRINGLVSLPDDPFNLAVTDNFTEDGDALNLVLVNEGTVSILRLEDISGNRSIIRAAVGQIDPSKLEIFAGAEIVEIDATTLLGEEEFAPVLQAGYRNQSVMRQMLENESTLATLYSTAGQVRMISDVSNGEVGSQLSEAVSVDRLVFSAELMTSNDYSVAGIVVSHD